MPALGTAGRFVGEGAAALVTITRNVVGSGLQGPGVKRAGHAVRTVSTAVNQRLKMHYRNRAVFFDACPEFHQHGMAPPVAIKNFFTCQPDCDRPTARDR